MGNTVKRDARLVKIRERQAAALRLRLAGKTYEQVAVEIGAADKSRARQDVLAAIQAIIKEPAEEVRVMELARLDAMLDGLWEGATNGDVQAVAAALKIQDRRAAYLGLDAPKKVEADIDVTMVKLSEAAEAVRKKLLAKEPPPDKQ